MCIRDSLDTLRADHLGAYGSTDVSTPNLDQFAREGVVFEPVSYTHLRAHETVLDLVCRLLLETKHNTHTTHTQR